MTGDRELAGRGTRPGPGPAHRGGRSSFANRDDRPRPSTDDTAYCSSAAGAVRMEGRRDRMAAWCIQYSYACVLLRVPLYRDYRG